MGNVNSIPIISQLKSFIQWIFGDKEGARATQTEFCNDNTFPVVSQIVSVKHGLTGDWKKAKDLQKQFVKDMGKGMDSMIAATRTPAVVIGGVLGSIFIFGGGPVAAISGGMIAGILYDVCVTEFEKSSNSENPIPYGCVAIWERIQETNDPGAWFDFVIRLLIDGMTGYAAAAIAARILPSAFPESANWNLETILEDRSEILKTLRKLDNATRRNQQDNEESMPNPEQNTGPRRRRADGDGGVRDAETLTKKGDEEAEAPLSD